jgi:hypothetical protein
VTNVLTFKADYTFCKHPMLSFHTGRESFLANWFYIAGKKKLSSVKTYNGMSTCTRGNFVSNALPTLITNKHFPLSLSQIQPLVFLTKFHLFSHHRHHHQHHHFDLLLVFLISEYPIIINKELMTMLLCTVKTQRSFNESNSVCTLDSINSVSVAILSVSY